MTHAAVWRVDSEIGHLPHALLIKSVVHRSSWPPCQTNTVGRDFHSSAVTCLREHTAIWAHLSISRAHTLSCRFKPFLSHRDESGM